jgi:N-methylhydantoinase B
VQLDPLTTQVIGSAVEAIAEEMAAVLVNAAYSLNIKQRTDRSCSVFDASGRVIAEAQKSTILLHLGSMASTLETLVARYPVASMHPGDMFIGNDPYNGGGQHLPDINIVAPVFHDGHLAAFVASLGHHSDVGGMVAGSESGVCRTIFQEGIRLPLVRLIRAGEIDEGIIDIVALNSRRPEDRVGDLRAQIAANLVGIRRLGELFDKYGTEAVDAAMNELMDYGERRIRAALRQIPDGSYHARDRLDSDGFGDASPELCLTMTVEGDRMMFDFSGTDPQVPSSRNSPLSATKAVVYAVVRTMIDPELPTNAGFYRAINVHAPAGCLLNPLPPAATSARASTAGVLGDVIVQALSKAYPERAMASSGPHQQILPSGIDPRTGKFFVDFESLAGGYGARPYRDGMDAVRIHASGGGLLPAEAAEIDNPLLVERTELRQDSGGPGQYRGGMSIRREYRFLTDGVSLSVIGERQKVRAAGLEGGMPGAAGRFILNPGTVRERVLPSTAADIQLGTGDLLRVDMPGGGGYGDPRQRDRRRVLLDLKEERISVRSAREDYGLDPSTLGEADPGSGDPSTASAQ